MPDFSLSPPIDPKVKDEALRLRYQFRHQLRTYAELAYDVERIFFSIKGQTVVDFCALLYPLVRKRIQRQDQRRRLKDVEVVDAKRTMCVLRAKQWLEFYNYPVFHLTDGTMRRRWIDQSGKERIGAAVVGKSRRAMVKKQSKDRTPGMVQKYESYAVAVGHGNRNARQINFFEDEMLQVKNSSLNTPVPEPTPIGGMFERNAVHGKQT